jgi:hypothetical protein
MSLLIVPQSARRLQLCSPEHARRIAGQLFNQNRQSVSVVKTDEPLQPLRVMCRSEVTDPSREIVVITS